MWLFMFGFFRSFSLGCYKNEAIERATSASSQKSVGTKTPYLYLVLVRWTYRLLAPCSTLNIEYTVKVWRHRTHFAIRYSTTSFDSPRPAINRLPIDSRQIKTQRLPSDSGSSSHNFTSRVNVNVVKRKFIMSLQLDVKQFYTRMEKIYGAYRKNK